MNQHRLTLSTALSLSRILLLAPVTYLLTTDVPVHRWWALGILLVAIGTDFFDGMLARRLHQVTDLGKIVDPLADKICVGVMVVVLMVSADIPVWFGLAVLGRDALIAGGALYIQRRKMIVPQSNWPGKISVGLIAAYLLTAVVRVTSLTHVSAVLLWASVVMMAVSLVSYGGRLFIGPKV